MISPTNHISRPVALLARRASTEVISAAFVERLHGRCPVNASEEVPTSISSKPRAVAEKEEEEEPGDVWDPHNDEPESECPQMEDAEVQTTNERFHSNAGVQTEQANSPASPSGSRPQRTLQVAEQMEVKPVEDILSGLERSRKAQKEALMGEDEEANARSPSNKQSAGYSLEPLPPKPSVPNLAGIHVVVQRCTKARLLVDEALDTWTEMGRGLVIYVSFSKGSASEAGPSSESAVRSLRQAAKSLLTAPLASSGQWQKDHADADSVVKLCLAGEDQGLLVVPQASLVSKLELGEKNLKYHQQCPKDTAAALFDGFVSALNVSAKELICSTGSKQSKESYEALAAKRAAAALIAPEQMFRQGEYEGKYSRYDERGIPTHGEDEAELPKSAVKKLAKLYDAQVKKYAKAAAAGAPQLAEPSPAAREVAEDEEAVTVPEGACLPRIEPGTFGGRQGLELMSSGPLTHSFIF